VDDSSRIFTLSTGPASEDIIGQFKIEKKEKKKTLTRKMQLS